MTAKPRRLLLAFAALGLGASAWSSYVHYSLLTQPGYTSVCDVNATVSCTQAYLSPYGSIWGIPVALGGVLFFALVLLLLAFAGRPAVARPKVPSYRENVPAYIFALSTVGLAFVLYLAWASFFQLGTLCLLCAATYVAVIGIFVLSGGATSFAMTSLPARATRDLATLMKSPAALVIALIFGVGAVSLIWAFPREAPPGQSAPAEVQYPPLTDQQKHDVIRWYEVQPKVDVPVDAGGAKVVLVKFNDFQCPACRETYVAYKALVKKHAAGGQFRYVLKHYPLEGECNAGAPGGTHRAACEAAAAIEMAKGAGAAENLEQWLFDNLQTLSKEKVKEGLSKVAGITDFDARYVQVLARVRADADLGQKLQVEATPTFFLNGRKIANLPPPALELLIEHELKRP
jgi:uncharacterized membrane protein/protein-disulfide isomerase